MKLQRIWQLDANTEPNHPLLPLMKQVNELNYPGIEEIGKLFRSMVIPEGFYAAIMSDEWGWSIVFYESYDDLKNESELNTLENASPE